MDWDDLEKRVENYDVDDYVLDEPKKSPKKSKTEAKKLKIPSSIPNPAKSFRLLESSFQFSS